MSHLARIVSFLLVGAWSVFAAETGSPAGHWEGAITLPGTELGLRVDLKKASEGWTGTIDIPVQGLRGYHLDSIKVEETKVSFVLPKIPGNPAFAGQFTPESISGDFTQGGRKFPFKLERKAKSASAGAATPSKGIPGTGLAGYWQGSLKVTSMLELRLLLEAVNTVGQLEATVISLDQGNARMVALPKEDAGQVHLTVHRVGEFDGKMSTDGSEIEGVWKQGGTNLPLVFRRLDRAPNLQRPQDPKPPFPYLVEEVVIENKPDHVKLAGTLTIPKGDGPFPGVVLITGSGPQDRDESLVGHRPFLVLADHLTRAGIAVLRYDDRGIGKSTGDFAKATNPDFVKDALAAAAWLKEQKKVDRIGLIGHSEGGIVAPQAAVARPEDIAFIVLLAGVGVPSEELLIRQWSDLARVMGAGEDFIAKNEGAQRELYSRLKEAKDSAEAEMLVRDLTSRQLAGYTAEQRAALGLSEGAIASQSKMAASPWFRQLLNYDPRPTLQKVKCPVLALNGEKDLQVAPKENLEAIRKALEEGGNKNIRIIEYPGMNHLFQTCKTGAIAEYSEIDETMAPKVLHDISSWILELP